MTIAALLRIIVGLAVSAQLVLAQCGPSGCYVGGTGPVSGRPSLRSHESIARIVHHDPSGASVGTGTLVAIAGGRGFLLTCAHLFEGEGQTEAQIAGASMAARVFVIDRRHDLALLEVASPHGRPVVSTDATRDGVYTACGYGGTGVLRCVRGPITGFATAAGAEAPSLRIRGSVRPGDSGGPVFDARGRLVAVIWGQRDGETYAMGGAPLRRILSRLPGATPPLDPVERTPTERPTADPRRDSVEKRLDDLSNRPDGQSPDLSQDVARRNELRELASQWDERFNRLRSDVHVGISASIQDRVRGLARAEPILTALGVGGTLGIALWLGRRWLQPPRRSERTSAGAAVAVDSPPPPQRVVPETHYVSYQSDDFARAHQWASEQLARKFPGSMELLTSLDSLIRQQLNGKD